MPLKTSSTHPVELGEIFLNLSVNISLATGITPATQTSPLRLLRFAAGPVGRAVKPELGVSKKRTLQLRTSYAVLVCNTEYVLAVQEVSANDEWSLCFRRRCLGAVTDNVKIESS
jgi:hypothetical protein